MRVIEHAAEPRFAREAAEVIDPEPFVDERRRMSIEEPWPDQRPRRKSEQGPRPGSPARAPFPECDERDGGKREQPGAEEPLGKEGDAGAGAEEDARAARQSVDAERDAGDERVVRDELVRVLQVAECRREEKRRSDSAFCGKVGEPER